MNPTPRIFKCSFCTKDISPGTGMMFARNDGVVYRFCSSKCKRNMLNLKRKPSRLKWVTTTVK